MPSAPERVVDDCHRDSPHPRVGPSGCPLRVVPRPCSEERLLKPPPSRDLSDHRPAPLVYHDVLPRWKPQYRATPRLREEDRRASRGPDELPSVARSELDVADPCPLRYAGEWVDVPRPYIGRSSELYFP